MVEGRFTKKLSDFLGGLFMLEFFEVPVHDGFSEGAVSVLFEI